MNLPENAFVCQEIRNKSHDWLLVARYYYLIFFYAFNASISRELFCRLIK